MQKAKLIFIMPVCFLASCSLLSPVKTDCIKTYVLTDTPCFSVKYATHPATILVTQPAASAIYNTTQIAYSACPYQISYFAKNYWADTPPKMLQSLMVQTLQRTHYFRTVMASALGNYDYVLNTQLLDLKQQFTPCASYVTVRLRAQVVNTTHNQVIATRQFCAVEPAPCCNPYGGVIAANRAVCRLLKGVAVFVTSVI